MPEVEPPAPLDGALSAYRGGFVRSGMAFQTPELDLNVHYGLSDEDEAADELDAPTTPGRRPSSLRDSRRGSRAESLADIPESPPQDTENDPGNPSSRPGSPSAPRSRAGSSATSPASRPPGTELDTLEPIPATFADDEVAHFVATLSEPRYSAPLSGDEIARLFQAFYAATKAKLRPAAAATADQPLLSRAEQAAHKKRLAARQAQARRTLEDVERKVTAQLYSKIFDNTQGADAAVSARLQARLDALRAHGSLLDQLDLGLDEATRYALEPAAARIAQVDAARSPADKLELVVEAHRVIVEVLGVTAAGAALGSPSNVETSPNGSSGVAQPAGSATPSADLVLPALVYALLASQLPAVWKNFLFIRRFRRADAVESGHHGYCLTNLEAALTVLDSIHLAPQNLPPDVDPAIFAPAEPGASASAAAAAATAAPHTPAHRRSVSSLSLASPTAARSRSASQSSKSSTLSNSMQARLGTFSLSVSNSYRYLLNRLSKDGDEEGFDGAPGGLAPGGLVPGGLAPQLSVSSGDAPSPPPLHTRFLSADADALTLGEARQLLDEYKRLAAWAQAHAR